MTLWDGANGITEVLHIEFYPHAFHLPDFSQVFPGAATTSTPQPPDLLQRLHEEFATAIALPGFGGEHQVAVRETYRVERWEHAKLGEIHWEKKHKKTGKWGLMWF